MTERLRLLGDIGGTHLRLAWQAGAGAALRDVRVFPCAQFTGLDAALTHYLQAVQAPPLHEAALGIANPITGDAVRMTNHSWQFSQRALQAAFGWQRLLLINDFTALALALPLLQSTQLRQIGGTAAVAGEAIALLGPGTGLGVSGLVFAPGASQGVPLSGEGGHATLAAQTQREWEVLEVLRARYGHVSAERAVSGQGLVDLYHAICALDAVDVAWAMEQASTPAAVVALALQGHDVLALEALEMLCAFLGTVAGDLALTLGARGGVYLGGGIVPRLGPWFAQSPFRARFERKGRFSAYLSAIPCWVVDADSAPALLGAAAALDAAQS